MADSEVLRRCLNPVILSLQKMELELKCPTCLKLLDLPIMLPCSHIFCSACITIISKNGCECPSCKLSFLHQDLRPAGYLNSLVNIYKDMNSVVECTFPHQDTKDKISAFIGKNMPASESPVSGNNYVKVIPLTELVHNMAKEKFSDERVRHRSKKHTENLGDESLVDNVEQYSPPSFGSIKDSDCDKLNRENEHGQPKQVDVGMSKRRRLNSEGDVGDQGRGSARDFRRPNLDCENNHESCSTHPLDTSTYPSANRIVKCVFCHSFRTTEASGRMLHLLNGKEVGFDQATQSNILHVHMKCIQWSPRLYYSGDTVMNLKAELSRTSRIKCHRCGSKGAALGCYVKSCKKSFHVPCAYDILECRWDCENYHMLCPAHSSHELPCDRSKAKSNNKSDCSPDPSAPSGDLTSPERPDHERSMPPGWARDMVLCRSALSKEEKCILEKFACITKSDLTNSWKPNVTHVIASVDENGGCRRTLKVLMAILTGKWILSIEWVKACAEAGHHVPEEPYEVTHDVHGFFDGPKIGRLRASEKAPKLFDGVSFYMADDFQQPSFRNDLEDLIEAGGGNLLKKNDLTHIRRAISARDGVRRKRGTGHGEMVSGEEISQKVAIVYSSEPPLGGDSRDLDEVLNQRSEKAEALAADVNGLALRHTSLLDHIAACHFE